MRALDEMRVGGGGWATRRDFQRVGWMGFRTTGF